MTPAGTLQQQGPAGGVEEETWSPLLPHRRRAPKINSRPSQEAGRG